MQGEVFDWLTYTESGRLLICILGLCFCPSVLSKIVSIARGGGGGYSIYPWMGRCGAAPYTLTLFKTNIADFPNLFKTEFRFLIPCLSQRKSVLINIRACKNFAVYHPRKDILFKTKIDKSIP